MNRAEQFASFEQLENRLMMSADIESYDGTGNNLTQVAWGSAGQALLRLSPSAYANGISSPAGASRPSARAISNAVVAHGDEEIPNARHLAAFSYLWGQFIDHDLDLTSEASPAQPFNIPVPKGDPYFDPAGTGTQVISLNRSKYARGTGVTSPRQQVNDITAYIDGSMVYGSSSSRAAALRTGSGGLMKTSAGNLLPYNTMGLDNATIGGSASSYFAAGDVRANENIELTAIQTLFVREHNRLARQIAQQNPTWTDEQIFQRARKLVIGEIQAITFNEFLPALLGPGAIAPYAGYRADVNAGIATEFSTAAFRLGHSMLTDDVEFLDNNGKPVRDEVALSQAFFNPALVAATGIDPILKYLASSNAEEIDTKIVDSLRNFLFGPPGAGGFDLASLNIHRGRDHGLPDYNSMRGALGLAKVTDFTQITRNVALQNQLKNLYGSVNNIDAWVGGLAEDHLPGSSLGPLFQRIIVNQFTRARDGDRFWYQRDLAATDLQMVQQTRLADVIRRNTVVTNLQDNVFVFNVQINGRVWNERNGDGRPAQLEEGLGNWRVMLLDDANQVMASTQSAPDGTYHFTGVQVGDYHVVLQVQAGWRITTPPPQILRVTRGMTFDRVDFGVQRTSSTLTMIATNTSMFSTTKMQSTDRLVDAVI